MSDLQNGTEQPLTVFAPGPLDPLAARADGRSLSPIEWCVMMSIADRLFEVNERGIPEPNLVASYVVSGNGTLYRFQIQPERRFHNGDEVTADDVIQSLTAAALVHPEATRILDLTDMTVQRGTVVGNSMRRISRYRFEVQLRDRYEGFLHYLALPVNSIQSKRAIENPEESSNGFSGPYRILTRDPARWELRIDQGHPAARVRSFQRVVIEVPPGGDASLATMRQAAATGDPRPTGEALKKSPCILLFAEPIPMRIRPSNLFKESTLKLPGERLYYLHAASDAPQTDHVARTIRSVVDDTAVQRSFFGLRPATFVPAVFPTGPGPRDRASAVKKPMPTSGFVIAVEGDSLPQEFLEAVESECRSRRVRVRFVRDARGGDEAPAPGEVHGYLRSLFVGNSLDEIGFFRRVLEETPPGCRQPGKSLLASVGAAARTAHRNARSSAIRRLAEEFAAEMGVFPMFQATAGMLADPGIDRESLAASGAGFTSFVSVQKRTARFDHAELNRAMLTALGAATQMFAHDVRRPFSMVRILLDMIRNAGSLPEIKEVSVRMLPEIERALGAVNGMIQDILEIGTAHEPIREVVPVETVLGAALREVFETRTGSDVRFTYAFTHTRPLHASQHQVHRVFANILSNAADAMKNQGTISFETQDAVAGGQPFVRVCIANTGPTIDPADLPRIFDAFYSRGKRSGTGLGLAITKKIIETHEGRIWCISEKDRGVQFLFTLPAHESEAEPLPAPPAHSRQIEEDYHQRTALSLGEDERRAIDREKQLAAGLAAFRQAHGRPLRLWVIDDETVYVEGVRNLIKDAFWYEDHVEIVSLRDAAEALAALDEGAPDACICDIDLGPASPDGFAVTDEMRRRGARAVIYIHSNRSVGADYRHAIEVGADAFLPKPLSRPHLLRLLDETTRESMKTREGRELKPERDEEPARRERQALLVVVDDEIFMRKAWTSGVPDASVLAYRGPSEFWASRPGSGIDWGAIDCIITDYHFGPDEREPVEEFLRKLKDSEYGGPVVLSSDTVAVEAISDLIDLRIDKRPIPWRELRGMLEGNTR